MQPEGPQPYKFVKIPNFLLQVPKLQNVPPKRTSSSTCAADPVWSIMPTWQAPRANPSSKGTSLISRLPLHYIILLDQEFLTVETWCGFWYESNKETLPKQETRLNFYRCRGITKDISPPKGGWCLPQLVYTPSQFYTNSGVYRERPKYARFVAVKENRKLFQSFRNAFSIRDQRYRLQSRSPHFHYLSSGILTWFPFASSERILISTIKCPA